MASGILFHPFATLMTFLHPLESQFASNLVAKESPTIILVGILGVLLVVDVVTTAEDVVLEHCLGGSGLNFRNYIEYLT